MNQMAGILCRELADGLTPYYVKGCLLLTGHPDTLALKGKLKENFSVAAAPVYDTHSKVRRILSWFKYLVVASRFILCSKSTDGFLISSNPPILAIWFWIVSYLRRRPYAVLVYDIYPDVLVMMGFVSENNPIVQIWHWFNKKVYRDARAVITIGSHMASRLCTQLPSENLLIHVIPPWVDVDWIKPIPLHENPLKKIFNPEGKRIILYSGNMGLSHDIDSILEAARLLRGRDDLIFLFFGNGEKFKDAILYCKRHRLLNVKIYPFQPEERIPMTMALATISLVTLDEGAEELMIPSKIFYYLAASSAVVAICKGRNELRDIVDENGCGFCVEPGDPIAISEIIVNLLDDTRQIELLRANARRASTEKFSKQIGLREYISLLRKTRMITDG